MPIVIAGLGVSLLLLLAAFGYLSLHETSVTLVRSLFGSWADQKGFRKWFFKAIGLNALAKALTYVERRVRSAISHAAAIHLPPITAWLHGMRQAQHETYKELGQIAHDAATAYDWIVRHTLPGKIAEKIAPVKATATHAAHTAAGAAVAGRADRRITFKGIDKLRKEMGLLAGILLGIDILVKKGHGRERHHADHTRTIPAHTKDLGRLKARDTVTAKELADHNTRIKRVEKALGLGVFAALIYRTLAKVAPWLFCRNWKKIGRAVCGLNSATVDSLLALLLATIVMRNLDELIDLSAAIIEETTGEVFSALGLPDLPSGRFTID